MTEFRVLRALPKINNTQYETTKSKKSINHRTLSNPRLQNFNVLQKQTKPLLNDQKIEQPVASENKQLKKYCLARFNNLKSCTKIKQTNKTEVKKIIRKESSLKFIAKTEIFRSQSSLDVKKHSEQTIQGFKQKKKIIANRLRIDFLKKQPLKTKLTISSKQSIDPQITNKNSDSFSKTITKCIDQGQKLNIGSKIQSQNLLGEGLKKCSSSKIKILVKNPFQKMMRLEESRQKAKNANFQASFFQQMNQSQINPKIDQSFTSFGNKFQIQQLIALI